MRKFIVLWYIMVAILVCNIVYKWYQENQTLISQTKEISEISNIRKGIRRIYMCIAELSLSGEMIFEWSDADFMLLCGSTVYTYRGLTSCKQPARFVIRRQEPDT